MNCVGRIRSTYVVIRGLWKCLGNLWKERRESGKGKTGYTKDTHGKREHREHKESEVFATFGTAERFRRETVVAPEKA